nr:EOG090X0AQH [Eulimnadia texana]
MMEETSNSIETNGENAQMLQKSGSDVTETEPEFAYPQVPSKKQQVKNVPDENNINNGTNSWDDSFNVSISGAENSAPAGNLQAPFLESTRIASTPSDQKNGPSFEEENDISQVQAGWVDSGMNDSKLPADQSENEAQENASTSLMENEIFKSLENSSDVKNQGVIESKSMLDKAFVSEATRTQNEDSSADNSAAQNSTAAVGPEEREEKSAIVFSEQAGSQPPAETSSPEEIIITPTLPQTVTELTDHNGVKIYLVGTAHFSLESQKDVAITIAIAQPNVVMVELCRSRLNILHMDEEAILKEAKDINFVKIRETIRQHGAVQGALYLLFLSTSAHLTRQLGMAPGGEFRRAYNEARNVPGCTVHLGDRPIHVTLQRALGALSLWQKMKLVWHLLTSRETISPEEVERCKQRDLLEELLKEMTGEFPALSRVFVQERDLCLAHSLQIAATAAHEQQRMRQDTKTPSVVAVVGIGHVPGMINYFGKVKESDVRQVMIVPPPSRSGKIFVTVVKYGLFGLVCYGAYKVLPVPRLGQLFK